MNIFSIFKKLTHPKQNAALDKLLLVAGIIVLIARLPLLEYQSFLNILVRIVVIISSAITSINYIMLMWKTRSTIKNIIIWQSLTIGLLGVISSLMLLKIIWKAIDMAMTQFSLIILLITAFVRLMHCYLAGGKANLMPSYMNHMYFSFQQLYFLLYFIRYQSSG